MPINVIFGHLQVITVVECFLHFVTHNLSMFITRVVLLVVHGGGGSLIPARNHM